MLTSLISIPLKFSLVFTNVYLIVILQLSLSLPSSLPPIPPALPWRRAGWARCRSACRRRRRGARAAGPSPATPWPPCGAHGGTGWSARSRSRAAPPSCGRGRPGLVTHRHASFFFSVWPPLSSDAFVVLKRWHYATRCQCEKKMGWENWTFPVF